MINVKELLDKIETYMKNPGLLVRTKNDVIGRTYKYKDFINDKLPVYPSKNKDHTEFSDKAILCEPETVDIIGYID